MEIILARGYESISDRMNRLRKEGGGHAIRGRRESVELDRGNANHFESDQPQSGCGSVAKIENYHSAVKLEFPDKEPMRSRKTGISRRRNLDQNRVVTECEKKKGIQIMRVGENRTAGKIYKNKGAVEVRQEQRIGWGGVRRFQLS